MKSVIVAIAGVSPSQASPETILKVDLYGNRARPGGVRPRDRTRRLGRQPDGAFITGSDILMDEASRPRTGLAS
jgi:hypothetical protein